MKKSRSFSESDAAAVRYALSALLVEREKVLLTLAKAVPYKRRQAEVVAQEAIANVDVDILLLRGCLLGEYGVSPNPEDIRIRDKADLELSSLIARRFHLRLMIAGNKPSNRPTSPQVELAALTDEIAAISERRSGANVRLFRAKRVKQILADVAVLEKAQDNAA